MILQTGARTDIPAFYSQWFLNRIREGYVLVRNPFNPDAVTRYSLSPTVVDALGFCTKNPIPMLPHLEELKAYPQYWFVTITPYGKDIEPLVPEKRLVVDAFQKLSLSVGRDNIGWRYDPIFISERYTVDYHRRAFERLAQRLEGFTTDCVVSFIDIFEKTKRNFPEARPVLMGEILELGEAMGESGRKHGIHIHSCAEGGVLERFGIDSKGCMTKDLWERTIGHRLDVPSGGGETRKACSCVLGSDIGEYNTCLHGCRYCYANYSDEKVRENHRHHDPSSPFLIGHLLPGDRIHEAQQKSWINREGLLF